MIPENDLSASVVDLTGLEPLRQMAMPGERDPVDELIEIFLEITPQRLQRLQDSLQSQDLETLHREAHTLKSSAGNFRAKKMAGLSAEIERIAKDPAAPNTAALIRELCQEYVRVEGALRARMSGQAC